jgi:hypothetical protein
MRSTVHRATAFAILLLFLCAASGLPAQQDVPTLPPIGQPSAQQPGPQTPDNGTGLPADMQKEMQKRANKQRQEELKRDTDKLLKLSTELKQYVDKSNENILSVEVIKKADEIERLAHSVKTKMRGN